MSQIAAIFLLVFVALGHWSCTVTSTRDELVESQEDGSPTTHQYSIKEDRSELEDLRSQIPEQKRVDNDELAFVLKLMDDEKRSPNEVRSRFDKALRKKQNRFRKDMRKERDDFNKKERKDRKAFLKKLDDERDDFKSSHAGSDREKTKDFYAEQNLQRKDFFAEAKDQRKEFEANHKQKRKDFYDYLSDQRKSFNEALKSYRTRYKEAQERKKLEKSGALKAPKKEAAPRQPQISPQEVESEFSQIPSGPGTEL